MPQYTNPGSAATNSLFEMLLQQSQLKRQAMLDALAQQRQDSADAYQKQLMAESQQRVQDKQRTDVLSDLEVLPQTAQVSPGMQARVRNVGAEDRLKKSVTQGEQLGTADELGPDIPLYQTGESVTRLPTVGERKEQDSKDRQGAFASEMQGLIERGASRPEVVALATKYGMAPAAVDDYMTALTGPKGANRQRVAGMLGGKNVFASYDPQADTYQYEGKDVTGEFRPPQTAGERIVINNQPQPAYKLSENDRKIAAKLSSGDLSMVQWRSLYGRGEKTGPQRQAVLLAAEEMNPNFSPAQFEIGYTFAKTPRVRQQISSLNNVEEMVPHLLEISDLAARTGIPAINGIVNKAGYNLGGKHYSNFHAAQIAFADELSGALGYGSATDMSREMGVNMTDGSLSPANFTDMIQTVVVPFVARKRSAILGQMGPYGAADLPGNSPAVAPEKPTAPGAGDNKARRTKWGY